ncbi:unknown [Clostridium sp. CAG:448]|nr:unknown [Clostridium sp. CAG:448]
MQLRIPGSHDHLEVLNGIVPHFDVVRNGIFKKNDVLIHNGKRSRKHATVNRRQRLAVKEDFPAPGQIKTGYELCNRGLSAPGSTHKRHTAARLQGHAEIPDQWLCKARIAEGDVFQLNIAGKLVVLVFLRRGTVKHRIGGILHHVLDPLHIGAHLLQGLPCRDQRHRRRNKRGKESLERHDHTDGERPLHRQENAGDQHRRAAERVDQLRQKPEKLIYPLKVHLVGIDACLVARPLLEKAVFGAACLDGFNHFNAGNRRPGKLTGVAHLHARDIDALFQNNLRDDQIRKHGKKPDQRQHNTVPEHHDQIKHHHCRLKYQRCKGIHQLFGNHRVCGLPPLNVACHPLGEKFHGHAQNLPHKGGVSYHRKLTADPQRVHRLNHCDNELNNADPRKRKDKRHQPAGILLRQQSVQKDARKRRGNHPEQRGNDRSQRHKGNRTPRTDQPFLCIGNHGLRLSARAEILPRRKEQADAREGFVKGSHGNGIGSLCGVVEHGFFAAEPVQNHKMVEIPVNDAGKLSLFPERLRLIAVPLGNQSVTAGGTENVPRV